LVFSLFFGVSVFIPDIEDTEDAGAWRTSVLVLPVSSVVTHTILRNGFFLAVEVCGLDLEVG